MIIEATKKIVENIDLTADEAAQVMDEMMSGEAEQICKVYEKTWLEGSCQW